MDVRRPKRHQRQDAPHNVAPDKDPFRRDHRQQGRRRDLEHGVADGVDGVHVVEIFALEVEIVAHAADVRS